MTIDFQRNDRNSIEWGNHEFDRALGSYDVTCIREDHPIRQGVADIASYIQGQDYVRSGYIEPAKLDDMGRLIDPMDRERIVTYFVAHPKGAGLSSVEASVKRTQVPAGGDLDVLAAWRFSRDNLTSEYRELIEDAFERDSAQGVVEIGGLTRVEHPVSKFVPYELIRELMQQAVRSETNEKWLITFTKKAFIPIMASFGPNVIRVAGSEVTINEPDEHVTLVPCVIEPCTLVDDMVIAIGQTEDPALKQHRIEVLVLMTDGLLPGEMDEHTHDFITMLAKDTVA